MEVVISQAIACEPYLLQRSELGSRHLSAVLTPLQSLQQLAGSLEVVGEGEGLVDLLRPPVT